MATCEREEERGHSEEDNKAPDDVILAQNGHWLTGV